MTQEQIVAKLLEIRPGAHWTIRGTTYESLEWLDDPANKPSREELGL